jgi:hypothetical protein
MEVRFVVLIHESRKLFFVCTHKTDTIDKSYGAVYQARKARELYTRDKDTRNISGLTIAMVNTDYKGWTDNFDLEVYSEDEAVSRKERLIELHEIAGYTNVGVKLHVSHGKGDGGLPSNWNSKFNVANMTKQKIYDKILFIERSMEEQVPFNVIHQAYMEIVTERRTVDYPIEDMRSLLKFVREKVGLES